MKQILMVGAGSVGGYFGAHLAKANLSVSFLLRTKTLAAVRQNGLTIRSADGSFTDQPSQQRERIYSEALDQLSRLYALVKQGRAYLQRRLDAPRNRR